MTRATFSGPPLPLFHGGWALIPFAGEKAHYWREVPKKVPRIHEGERVRYWLALCGNKAETYRGVHALERGGFEKCARCMMVARRVER